MVARRCWQLVTPGQPLRYREDEARQPGAGEVLLEVAGCGCCHTDLSFLDGHVAPRAPLPLVLGHEISGRVLATGPGAEGWAGKQVVAPSVIPCGACAPCKAGRGNICAKQFMPGNDGDGGFASHVTLPAVGLTEVRALPPGLELADMAVISDAVSTALQAVRRARVAKGDVVVVVGAGGVGGYATQVAAAAGARVVALDVNDDRLELVRAHGASTVLNVKGRTTKEVRDDVRAAVKALGAPPAGWKVFECSGTTAGQESAWNLLSSGGVLAVVGYTRDPISIRLSNLMAFDAEAFGSWGCPPELYPECVELVVSGRVRLEPFVRRVPMSDIVHVLEEAHSGKDPRRAVLVP